MIANTHSCARRRGVLSHLLGLDPLGSVQPDDAVIGSLELGSLDEIQPSKNHGG
jgi:hypothetical protein